MIVHTTNYHNTFIEVAADCPVRKGEVTPKGRDLPVIARLQFLKKLCCR